MTVYREFDEYVSPYLARTAVVRTGTDEIPGYYSNEIDMWVVESEGGATPIIQNGSLAQLKTKTEVIQEEDDESPYSLDLTTKTAHQIESDDHSPDFSGTVLQLMTKTDTVQEKDDKCDTDGLLQLVTKTKVQSETDDSDPYSENW